MAKTFDIQQALRELEEFRRTGISTAPDEELDFSNLGPKRPRRSAPAKKTTKKRNKT